MEVGVYPVTAEGKELADEDIKETPQELIGSNMCMSLLLLCLFLCLFMSPLSPSLYSCLFMSSLFVSLSLYLSPYVFFISFFVSLCLPNLFSVSLSLVYLFLFLSS